MQLHILALGDVVELLLDHGSVAVLADLESLIRANLRLGTSCVTISKNPLLEFT
jgi:hypothetical protein